MNNHVMTKASDLEILRFMALHPDPVTTTSELSDEFDMTSQAALNRLNKLAAHDHVDSKKVGARARVFWLTDEGRDYIADVSEIE